jgi:hypothetical protein
MRLFKIRNVEVKDNQKTDGYQRREDKNFFHKNKFKCNQKNIYKRIGSPGYDHIACSVSSHPSSGKGAAGGISCVASRLLRRCLHSYDVAQLQTLMPAKFCRPKIVIKKCKGESGQSEER